MSEKTFFATLDFSVCPTNVTSMEIKSVWKREEEEEVSFSSFTIRVSGIFANVTQSRDNFNIIINFLMKSFSRGRWLRLLKSVTEFPVALRHECNCKKGQDHRELQVRRCENAASKCKRYIYSSTIITTIDSATHNLPQEHNFNHAISAREWKANIFQWKTTRENIAAEREFSHFLSLFHMSCKRIEKFSLRSDEFSSLSSDVRWTGRLHLSSVKS